MTRTKGFTLIELLTVMAIIAILSAIIFPVFMRAKVSARRSADISNMNALRTALQLYRTDQGAYPPALLGYVTLYDSGPDAGNVIPADQVRNSPLYPKRIDSVATLRPSNLRAGLTETTPAVWPLADERAVGAAPVLDLNGDGSITNADDIENARQVYGPTSGYYISQPPYITANADDGAQFYRVSGYEVAQVPGPGGARTELRYSLFWTRWGTGVNSANQLGHANDDPRQLGYTDPPEGTVVTWNSFFRDYNQDGSVQRNRNEIVLFLGGSARPFDSADVAARSWRVLP